LPASAEAVQFLPVSPPHVPSPPYSPDAASARRARGSAGLLGILAACAWLALGTPAQASGADASPAVNAGPYVPSPESAVSAMLRLADIRPDDFVIDLGSGDGRIVLTAAKLYGASGFGVEIKDELVVKSNQAAREAGLAERVRFITQDLFKTDISRATVLTMYLLPATVNLLSDKLLAELRPGTRVLSHDYPLAGWLPDDVQSFEDPEKEAISGVTRTVVYLYRIPASVQGTWRATLPEGLTRHPLAFHLRQQMTQVNGMARLGQREVAFQDLRLRGTELTLRLRLDDAEPLTLVGQVGDGRIDGTVMVRGQSLPWSATRAR
jgi:SAM-dependent methyltransferase